MSALTNTALSSIGRAWADREADACEVPAGAWRATHHDAYPLCPAGLDTDDRIEMAEAINAAAASRWSEILAEYADADEAGA